MTPNLSNRPLPALTDANRHFWTGGAQGRLQFLGCPACGHLVHPPAPICPQCMHRTLAVQAVSGQGQVASFTINHQPWRPGLDLPYVVAIVELDEQPGLRLTTNIVNCAPHDVHIGQRVRVLFVPIEDVWIPLFEPLQP